MKSSDIIGVDISKDTLDLACQRTKSYLKIQNNMDGFNEMMSWLKEQKVKPSKMMMVMEHTGLCSYHLEAFLQAQKIDFTKVPALAIKRSLGLIRGKTDKLDAFRIARYGYEKKEMLVKAEKPGKCLERLQLLHCMRNRFVKSRSAMMNALKEYKGILASDDMIIAEHHDIIKQLTEKIQKIEKEIQLVINQDGQIKKNYELLRSCKGIGKVISVAMINVTANFTRFRDGRKFSCYCGTAPFEHSSGKSIKKRTRVSHLANKEMKTLLDLSAKCVIQTDEELKQYYQKRVEQGKPARSVRNIIRNKLIYHMFAVINRGTPFIDRVVQAA